MKESPRKFCSNCGKRKHLEQFHKNKQSRDGRARLCKPCACAKSSEWREANQERARKSIREWRAANKERENENARSWRKANKDKIAGYTKKRASAQKESAAKWYQKNRSAMIERSRVWKKENRARARLLSRTSENRRRARKMQADGAHTAEDVQEQYERQKGRCYWCGKRVGKNYHVDHIVPLSRGGSNWPENIVLACPSCNISKSNKLPHEWPQGNRLL
jgi:5-methylcytosine-specific restriction endonuclease McrA